jgi:hypothetical protein
MFANGNSRYRMPSLLLAGFLAFTALGGCAGNNAELTSKMNASYHTHFPSTVQQPVQLSAGF